MIYIGRQMNWLGFEGREVKVKVATRSDVKNFRNPYLLNSLTDFDKPIYVCSTPRVDKLFGFSRSWIQSKSHSKVKCLSESLWRAKVSTSTLGVEVSFS